jgi:CRP-like cAMP-binding protein
MMPSEVFLLVDGLILLTCSAPGIEGECTSGVRFPGQVVEPCAHNLDMPYPVSANVLVKSQVLRISIAELRKAEQENPRAAAFFQRMLSVDLYNAALFIAQLKKSVPADRLNHFLHVLASAMGSEPKSGKVQISMPFHDDQIADILGFSPRHFKRVKKRLHDEGYLRVSARLWAFSESWSI